MKIVNVINDIDSQNQISAEGVINFDEIVKAEAYDVRDVEAEEEKTEDQEAPKKGRKAKRVSSETI